MARIRSIKPEFWTDSLMVQLPPFVRLVYIALWSAADDHGNLPAEMDRLAMELMPRESVTEFILAVDMLELAGRVEHMVDDNDALYLRIPRWKDHQRIDKPSKSKIAREGSRKLAIPAEARRAVATKYGCKPGKRKAATCYYCGAPGTIVWHPLNDTRASAWVSFTALELDHAEAEFNGGANTAENLVLACRTCNRSKGHKEFLTFLESFQEVSRVLANTPGVLAKNVLGKGSGSGKDQGKGGGGDGIRDTSRKLPSQPAVDRSAYAEQERELRAAAMPHELLAFDTLIREHPHPDALVLELHATASGLHVVRGMTTGKAADITDVMRAVAEMAANGKTFSVSLFRGFVRRIADRKPEPASTEERQVAKLQAEIAKRAGLEPTQGVRDESGAIVPVVIDTDDTAEAQERRRIARQEAMAKFRAEAGRYRQGEAA